MAQISKKTAKFTRRSTSPRPHKVDSTVRHVGGDLDDALTPSAHSRHSQLSGGFRKVHVSIAHPGENIVPSEGAKGLPECDPIDRADAAQSVSSWSKAEFQANLQMADGAVRQHMAADLGHFKPSGVAQGLACGRNRLPDGIVDRRFR